MIALGMSLFLIWTVKAHICILCLSIDSRWRCPDKSGPSYIQIFGLNQVSKTYLLDIDNLHIPICSPYKYISGRKTPWEYLHPAYTCLALQNRPLLIRPNSPRNLDLDSHIGRDGRIYFQSSTHILRHICIPTRKEDFCHIQIYFVTNSCHMCHGTLVAVYMQHMNSLHILVSWYIFQETYPNHHLYTSDLKFVHFSASKTNKGSMDVYLYELNPLPGPDWFFRDEILTCWTIFVIETIITDNHAFWLVLEFITKEKPFSVSF